MLTEERCLDVPRLQFAEGEPPTATSGVGSSEIAAHVGVDVAKDANVRRLTHSQGRQLWTSGNRSIGSLLGPVSARWLGDLQLATDFRQRNVRDARPLCHLLRRLCPNFGVQPLAIVASQDVCGWAIGSPQIRLTLSVER